MFMSLRYGDLGPTLEHFIKRNVEGKSVGVAFSGGLDSGLVAAIASKYARSVTCYTCGTDDAFDVRAGEELAEKLGLQWRHCRIGEDNIESTIRELISATGTSDPFTISYELQLFTVCRMAEEPIILTGQGSDEYFGGCARSVNEDDSEYEAVMDWGIERLMKVSVPCEQSIAKHFGKRLVYPFLDGDVIDCVNLIDPDLLRPRTLEDRKVVLKEVASDLGFPLLAHRIKKASQYGSGTTDLIRNTAKSKGMRYNRFIASIYESLGLRNANLLRDAAVDVRMDPILVYDAEIVLKRLNLTHSEAMALFYKRMVNDGNLEFLL
ncbi:MAG: hypothetical protein E7Z67_03840 [Thermoplasmata archaeon]|nr:hypothetical protein [Thermoplasmata archaeon]